MRSRWLFCVVAVALAVGACGKGSTPPRAERGPSDLLVLTSTDGLTALDSGTGSVLFTGAATPALADGSELFATTHTGSNTIVEAIGSSTGKELSQARLRGDLTIRAVSSDGRLVALGTPLPAGTSPWTPQPRAFTDVVVADVTGAEEPMRFHLEGNFEPEAFSSDGETLYMISYVPATAPTAYRVVSLYLEKGKTYLVYGRSKTAPETMRGSRLMQVPSADGSMLFTLYTSQPASYARGYDSWQAKSGHDVAFVHTLSLENGWAVCVPLPKQFSEGDPQDEALAASSDGRLLYAVDTRQGILAELDARKLKVVRTARVDFGSPVDGQTHAALSPDGSKLLVSSGSSIASIDIASLRRTGTWTASGSIGGLGFSQDGRRVYAVMNGEVQVLDPATGQDMRMIRAPGVIGMQYVGPLDR